MESLSDILNQKKNQTRIKPPAYPWQDLALRIINELGVPGFKRASVFQVCKNKTTAEVERALNDTKELCHDGAKWKYFFKIIDKKYEDKI